MEQFKGTRGSWSLIHSKSKTGWNVIGTKLGGRYKIAQLPYLSDPELSKEWNDKEKQEQLYNALLISKAPEILDMLIKIDRFIDLNRDKNYMVELLSREVPEIKELIKEATENKNEK